MRVASKSSKYEKHQERGLFLSEHRRCYDEIIDYCNKLVYKGHLEPMRGKASKENKYRLADLSISPLITYRWTLTNRVKEQGVDLTK